MKVPYKDRDKNRQKINDYQREWAREWRKKNNELFRKQMREYQAVYRKGKGWKAWYDKYVSNPEVRERLLAVAKKYYHENKESVNKRDRKDGIDLESKRYLSRALLHDGINAAIIKQYPELIELKRFILNIKRVTK